MMKQKLVWADSLKGLLMILVVMGHSIQYTLSGDECESNHIWNYIYSFHMPAFMAVSGYLNCRLGGTNRLRLVYRRFQQLLIPYFVWELIYRLLGRNLSVISFYNIFLHPYFWFLWVLFFINVTFQIGDWLAEKLKVRQEFSIIAIGVLFMMVMIFGEVRILGFQFIAYYYIYYAFGYYLHKYPKLICSNNGILAALIIVWALMAWFWKNA